MLIKTFFNGKTKTLMTKQDNCHHVSVCYENINAQFELDLEIFTKDISFFFNFTIEKFMSIRTAFSLFY
jgi:hypothetical protein